MVYLHLQERNFPMKKVTLKELVADKIIFAVLVALYYWMWARND